MKLVLALVLCFALTQALPRASKVTPRQILFPEWALNPRLTGSEWEAIREANVLKPEVVKNFRPGTVPQIESAGTSYGEDRIIGGSNAASGQFPWQVSITMDRSYFCGGSLISDIWVLTAGHCVDDVKNFVVVSGSRSPDGDTGSLVQTSREGILHEDYDAENIQNDIGLIELPNKITISTLSSPVRLPSYSQASETFVGTTATISGWGRTSDSSSSISPVLRWVSMPVISNMQCANSFGSIITSRNICTNADETHATCNGDSGGPLVILETDGLYTEVGVVSFGSSAGCEKGKPDAFTRVTAFLNWIETNTGIAIKN